MQNSQKKNMHATLLDKNGPKRRRNRLAKEFKHPLQNFLAEYAVLLISLIFGVYTDRVNTQAAFCMRTINLHHRELEFRHLI